MTFLFDSEESIDFKRFSQVFNPDIRKVISVVRKYGFDIRVVGGAVRDFIRGVVPRDVDFATDAEPAELIFIFDLEGIGYDASGIKHGTIKAVFGKEKVDVTSITYRMKVINGGVRISRRTGWKTDGKSRDFTINSMSIDLNGRIHDYTGGITDLKNSVVRFCPGAKEQIGQDPNVIMRWFKALTYFSNPTWPKKDQEIIMENLPMLADVKDDRRTKLILDNINQSPNGKDVNQLICRLGAARYLGLTCKD